MQMQMTVLLLATTVTTKVQRLTFIKDYGNIGSVPLQRWWAITRVEIKIANNGYDIYRFKFNFKLGTCKANRWVVVITNLEKNRTRGRKARNTTYSQSQPIYKDELCD